MSFVFINIGSNLGDRRLVISRGVRSVALVFGDIEISHVVESPHWGIDSTNSFLNVGMMFRSDLAPEEILDRLQAIEKSISPAPHRDADGRYIDRIIDIDIIAIDSMQLETPRLTIPHPRLAERRFFLEPMLELAPAWRHPASGLTPREMLLNIEKS